VNIYDIAEKAGVSIATVSRVINANGPVSPQTTKKVLDVINELGYTPNIFAKGLSTNSMRVIGVLTTNINDLYYAAAINTIEQNAKKNGYDILLSCTSSGLEDKKKHINLLIEKRIDGLILIGSIFKEARNNTHILRAAQALPVVTLNSCVEGKGIYSVYCDDEAGTRAATQHLIAAGRKSIAYVYDVSTYSGLNKLEGYKTAMQSAGLPPVVLSTDCGITGGFQAADRLLTQGTPDGIVCSEDELAVGVLKRLSQSDIRVPDDTAVIGYNNSLLSRCTNPELASVDGKVQALSTYALETMLKAIETGDAPQKTVVTPELILRKSAE
jgi:DNA-binding LacI/PurR family transcriptional regulator